MKDSQDSESYCGDDENRGVIRNRRLANQVKDFSGLRYGKITPTDIDGLVDFGNQAFVFIELKYHDSQIPFGQRLAIERLVDAIKMARKPALAIIARHTTTDGDIDVAGCAVTELRFNGIWQDVTQSITVREIVDRFLKQYAPKYL